MWRMQDGNRVLTEAEWDIFRTGLDLLRDYIEQDIADQKDDTETGVPVFDRLTAEQKLALVADVAVALRDPSVPMPHHTAANEGAIMAVLVTFGDMLREEVEANEEGMTQLRGLLRAAVANSEDRPERLPKLTNKKWHVWADLLHAVEVRIFWDYDFDMGEEFLDLPPDEARLQLRRAGIDPDYYLEIPPEPGERGLIAARQTLARLIGLPVPDDDGLYPALEDLYHHLCVGPVAPDEIAAWEKHAWVQITGSTEPGWDCDYTTWRKDFSEAVPAVPFQTNPANAGASHELPSGVRVEPFGNGWVVRDEQGSYWCGLTENGWTSDPNDEMPALSFPTEADASAAYTQADKMYGERVVRRKQAMARLGFADE